MIGDYFKENPDARVIVFVKTRELVKAIETYMKETEELRILNPIQFVGVQANKERGGKDKNWCFKVIHCTIKWFSFFFKWIDSSICFEKKKITGTEKLSVVEISMPRNKHLWCWRKWG